jgi:hypothetical protein
MRPLLVCGFGERRAAFGPYSHLSNFFASFANHTPSFKNAISWYEHQCVIAAIGSDLASGADHGMSSDGLEGALVEGSSSS